MNGVIYCTTNLTNAKKYIGIDRHNNPKYLGSGTNLKQDLKVYGSQNFVKEILQYCNSDQELNEAEEYWINYFGAVTSDLFYNIRYGGKRGTHIQISMEQMVATRIATDGYKRKSEWNEKTSNTMKLAKRSMSESTRIALSNSNRGRKRIHPVVIRTKWNDHLNIIRKPIAQLTIYGNFVAEHESISAAAKSINGVANVISRAVSKKKNTAYGFIWNTI